MIIEKVLNNNVVVSIDPKTKKEIILLGSGIAFNRKIGQEVDESKIEKTFILDDKTLGNKFKKLINQIPDGVFQLSHEIISHASKELNVKFDKQIYISLSDHIAFAIKRYKKNMMIKEIIDVFPEKRKNSVEKAIGMKKKIDLFAELFLPDDFGEGGFSLSSLANINNLGSMNNLKLLGSLLRGDDSNNDDEDNNDELNYEDEELDCEDKELDDDELTDEGEMEDNEDELVEDKNTGYENIENDEDIVYDEELYNINEQESEYNYNEKNTKTRAKKKR